MAKTNGITATPPPEVQPIGGVTPKPSKTLSDVDVCALFMPDIHRLMLKV
jgi:branched-chain amino acid aminotransferase